MPFSRYFYFKKDTPADVDWKRKAKDRNGSAARELGGYQAYGEWGWNDELLVGDKTSTQEALVEALVQDAVPAVVEGESVDEAAVVERPLQRKTDADTQRDLKRLDRALDRTLYLVVKYQNRGWQLPSGSLEGKENLHQVCTFTLAI
jgi:large subunit ribosomal protein L46